MEIDNSGSVSDDWPTTYYKGAAVWYALVSSCGLAMRGIRIGKVTPTCRARRSRKSPTLITPRARRSTQRDQRDPAVRRSGIPECHTKGDFGHTTQTLQLRMESLGGVALATRLNLDRIRY